MKKTLFLSAILASALCSSAFAETLTLTTNTTYSNTISEDTIDLNGHKLTFNTAYDGNLTLIGSTAASIIEASGAQVDLSDSTITGFTGAIALAANSTLTTSENAESLQHVSMTGNGSTVSLGSATVLTHGTDFDLNTRSTYGIQKWAAGTSTLKLTGANSAKGLYVANVAGAELKLVAAGGSRASLSVTDNLNIDENTGKVTVGDGMSLLVSKYNNSNVTQGFRQMATEANGLSKIETAGTGCIALDGNQSVDYSGTANADQLYSFIRGIHVKGALSLQTNTNWGGSTTSNFATWDVGEHALVVDDYLHLRNHQLISLSTGGILSVGGQVQLGHQSNETTGKYAGRLNLGVGSKTTMNDLYFYAGGNQANISGEITFTKTDGNVLSGLLDGAGTANNTVNLTDAKLDAVDNSWTMTAGTLTNASTTAGHGTVKASVSLAGNTTLNVGAEKSITLGNASVQGTVTGSGALTLNNATLAGNLTLQAADDAATTVTLTGTLTNSDTANKSITVGTGATLVMNDNTKTGLKLAGGTVKVSGTGDFNAQHFSSLTLTADSTLDLTSKNSGLINKNGSTFINSTLNLGEGNTLTINGTTRFCVMDAVTTGTGKIAMGTNGGYLQIAHSGVKDHLADLSSAVVELYGTHLVIAGGNTLKVAALDQHADSTTGSTLETEGSGNGSGVLEIVGDGGTHTYRGGVHANADNIEIAMTGAGTQKFSMSGNMQLHALTADAGTMNFYLNNNVLSAGSLTLSGGAVNVFKGDNNSDAGQITTSNLTVETTTELEANLVISAHGTMDFSSGATLTMGCTVTIGDDVTVIVSSDVLNYISRGEAMTIMYGVDNATLESITLGDVHFVMNGAERPDFFFVTEADEENGGMKLMVAPEPATATLSLLALAGLAARRRRH